MGPLIYSTSLVLMIIEYDKYQYLREIENENKIS